MRFTVRKRDTPISIRLPEELCRLIEKSAMLSKRSRNREIIMRLAFSLGLLGNQTQSRIALTDGQEKSSVRGKR